MLNSKNKNDIDFDRFNKLVYDDNSEPNTNINENVHKEDNRLKSMYVVNLTSTRMGILLGVLSSVILIIFIIGFQMGAGKNKTTVTKDSGREELLFRDGNSSIVDMNEFSKKNNSIEATAYIENNNPIKKDTVEMSILTDGFNANSIDDIDSMLSSDLDDMGSLLNTGKKNSVNISNNENDLLNSYANSEPASYIAGEKSTSSTTFTTTSPSQTYATTTKNNSTTGDTIYFIQVAVANSEKAANIERDYLRNKNFSRAFVVDGVAKDGSTMYKLKIGRYNTRNQAEEALSQLKSTSSKYSDSYIYTDKL